jgi:hypothetical protein
MTHGRPPAELSAKTGDNQWSRLDVASPARPVRRPSAPEVRSADGLNRIINDSIQAIDDSGALRHRRPGAGNHAPGPGGDGAPLLPAVRAVLEVAVLEAGRPRPARPQRRLPGARPWGRRASADEGVRGPGDSHDGHRPGTICREGKMFISVRLEGQSGGDGLKLQVHPSAERCQHEGPEERTESNARRAAPMLNNALAALCRAEQAARCPAPSTAGYVENHASGRSRP